MFNHKKVKELTTKLNEYKNEIDHLNSYIYQINSDLDSVPEDCKQGLYCSSCAFAEKRTVLISVIPGIDTHRALTHYVCKKGNVCKNYTPADLEED